ncbi:pilus assembly protein [Limibaculum sp. FT325]|uniref:TadE/TadG family type IV pilus assembly protein n=1 Tax=Thermohalobaculum sediminis TaxID=2939436 RepID=UPI0020BEED31|nr:TadE family protein [Limibaculum sediminis]MCL5777124.1 pilus assembly protein [Limibaculum sediminis]
MSAVVTLRRLAARFVAEERGTATVELVVWIPFFMLMLFVIIDASTFYWRYTAMWDMTRDLARDISIGRYGIIGTETYTAVTASLNADVQQRLGGAFTAQLIDGGSFDPGLLVTADVRAMSIFNFFGTFLSDDPTVATYVRLHKEPF